MEVEQKWTVQKNTSERECTYWCVKMTQNLKRLDREKKRLEKEKKRLKEEIERLIAENIYLRDEKKSLERKISELEQE